MKMKHKSFVAAVQPKKTTVQLHTVVNAYKPVANHAGNIAHEKMKKSEGKKSRDDKERVLEILFGLFEKHQYYNIKDLAKGTNQPITYLVSML
jgi:transcription initiation factor TFIIF subunit beta